MTYLLVAALLVAQGYGRQGMDATKNCNDSAVVGLDPDVSAIDSYQTTLRILGPDRRVLQSRDHVYPTRECCERVREVALELRRWIDPVYTIDITDCR